MEVAGPLGTPLGLAQRKRASPRGEAGTSGPTHVARLEFPRETGLILRCAGKAGNPFQTTQGNRLSCRDQEGSEVQFPRLGSWGRGLFKL